MKKLFEIGIGRASNGKYIAAINSLTDNKHCAVDGDNMKLLMTKVSKRIRKKNLDCRLFPLPEPRRVNGAVKLAEPVRN